MVRMPEGLQRHTLYQGCFLATVKHPKVKFLPVQVNKDIRRRDCGGPFSTRLSNTAQASSNSLRRRVGCCCATQVAGGLEQGLKELDKCLESDSIQAEKEAVALMERLKAEGQVKAYGNGHQVPKQAYSLADLRLNKIEPIKFLSPQDKTLNQVRTILQASAVIGLGSLSLALHLEANQVLQLVIISLFALTADQVANGGGFEALAIDAAGRVLNKHYASRVASHEAGHFLVAYLIGLLPKKYILSSVDAFKRYRALNVQAGTQFCDNDFQKEVAGGKMSSSSLDRYCCVALSGVATEYLLYGEAEGGLNDVQQLDSLLKALQFSQQKADNQVRWAVLNVTEILRRHKNTHKQLTEAMMQGRTVGECIAVIESTEQLQAL